MKVIGITGYIGSGKSTVSRMFASRGIYYFDSDSYVSSLNTNKKVINEIKKYFPNCIINGTLDKNLLRTEIFSNYNRNILILEKIYHPYVYKKVKKLIFISKIIFRKAILLEVPLLFQSKINELCDLTILVKCSKDNQIKRVIERSNGRMKIEDLDRIMKKQNKLNYDTLPFTYIINTDVSSDKVEIVVENIIKEIM